jgi:two-component system phosphate regulon sensor histidine kinase PhoR
MKRRIFVGIIAVMIACYTLIAVILGLTLSGGTEDKDFSAAFATILPSLAAATLLAVLLANLVARRLSKRISSALDEIDQRDDSAVVYDEILPHARKVSRQKLESQRKIAELTERVETIETIVSNMREGFILIDSKGMALTANNSARQIFGDDIEGRNILYINREIEFSRAVKQCLAGESVEMRMDRGGRNYSVFLSPVGADASEGEGERRAGWRGVGRGGRSGRGGRGGASILFQDITARYIAERQRREFSANVSHELRTPLTAITALSEMIENGMTKESDVRDFAGEITKQSARLLVLIEDIIRLSEFDEGGVARDNTVFDLWELAEAVIAAPRNNLFGIVINLDGEHFSISANRRMIEELLQNLIDNAVKYNKEGGRVDVTLFRVDGDMCKIAVSDTGIGIPPRHVPRVFERFHRVDKSRSKKTGGTGLGLSIVKHVAEYHGGKAEIESVEGEGTTVTCYVKMG